MEPTHDSRGPEDAAAEKTAGPGGNGTREPAQNGRPQSGSPRSWRQYIDENLPVRSAGTEPEQENADSGQPASGGRARTRSAWERRVRRTARRARERGSKIRAVAGLCREKLGSAAAAGRERRSGTAGWKKLSDSAAARWKRLSGTAAAGWGRLSAAAAAGREKLYGTAGWRKFSQNAEKVRGAVARHPISPLLYVTVLAVAIGAVAFQGNYARAFELKVNGQKVGLVSSKDELNAILGNVETRAASLLGAGFDYEVDVTLSPVYAAPDAISDAAEVEAVLFGEMGAAYVQTYTAAAPADKEDCMLVWALSVDGEVLGYAADSGTFYRMLDDAAQPWLPADAVRYEFVEDVRIHPVELPLGTELDSLDPVWEELNAMRVEEAVYVVKKGDTFNAIAYSLGMWPNELSVLNPDVMVDRLSIGQELVIQQAVPRLSVLAVANETYEEAIPSPVEYIETADLYVGNTKVKEQGKDGLALVNADVTYINNVEQGREVLESTTLEEATTTYTYTGTTPRPKTASNGYFIWPVRGTITSNFGARDLWGSYDYHLGIDIACPSGTSIKAADGGTVITAGWNSGGYGYLVVIRHDNGMHTYYAHNSSILVKVGDKVYQGQVIAKAGMTGKADGPHCHFEVRVNGTSVNPRKYLS